VDLADSPVRLANEEFLESEGCLVKPDLAAFPASLESQDPQDLQDRRGLEGLASAMWLHRSLDAERRSDGRGQEQGKAG
jgi:hypothetical protein